MLQTALDGSQAKTIKKSCLTKTNQLIYGVRTGKEIRFRFGSSEDKAGKEAKRRPTGW